jgi:hypothetical protein
MNMMAAELIELTGQAAANASVDLSAAIGLNSTNYPLLVSISGWVDTADPLDPSVVTFGINYLDATGNSRLMAFQATTLLIMNDSTQFFASDTVLVRRQDWDTAFTLDIASVAGAAAGARYTINVLIAHEVY